jgi:hypothetical protein
MAINTDSIPAIRQMLFAWLLLVATMSHASP